MTEQRAIAVAMVFSGASGVCLRMRVDHAGNGVFRPEREAVPSSRVSLPVVAAAVSLAACAGAKEPPMERSQAAACPVLVTEKPEVDEEAAPAPVPVPVDEEADAIRQRREIAQIEDGGIVVAPYVHFRAGSWSISGADNQAMLDEIAKVLIEHPEIVRLAVIGHTDSTEKQAAELSLARAKAVVRYLKAKGVDGARLAARGVGATDRLDPADTSIAHKKNRRVSFSVEK